MELVVVMPPAAESVRLKPPRPAVEAPLPVRATESPKHDADCSSSNRLCGGDARGGEVCEIY